MPPKGEDSCSLTPTLFSASFFTMLIFAGFFIWIWLLVVVFADIFRSHDMGGFAKALWVLLVIFLPLVGVLIYLIARGSKMQERTARDVQEEQQTFDSYVKGVASSDGSAADQLAKLGETARPRGDERCRVPNSEGQGDRLIGRPVRRPYHCREGFADGFIATRGSCLFSRGGTVTVHSISLSPICRQPVLPCALSSESALASWFVGGTWRATSP